MSWHIVRPSERERQRKSEVRRRGERDEGMCKPICTLEICCVRVLLTHYHAVMEKGAYISMQTSARAFVLWTLSVRTALIIHYFGSRIRLFVV